MSKVDDELTRRLRRAERPLEGGGLFEGLERRRSHRERVRRVQAGLLAFAVLGATAGGFAVLRSAFEDERDTAVSPSPSELSANGEIVFSREGADGRSHLYASQPDGSGVRQITDDATNDTDPAVSPGGEAIAYVHELDREIPEDVSEANPDTPRLSVIATVPVEGGVVSWHTPDELFASDPAWSPDGTQIAFVGQRGTSSHLYVVGVDSLEPESLTSPLDVQVADPTWSPDGIRIAFALRGPVGPWGLASIRPDGTGLEPLAIPVSDEDAPAWSPDGSSIALMRPYQGKDAIWTMPATGGKAQLVAYATELEHDLAWAPDGTALLVSDGEWIYRVDPSPQGDPDGNLVQLVEGLSPAWQPLPAGSLLSPTPTPEPTVSPSPQPAGRDIGLGFRLCHLHPLSGIDFLGDGTDGRAWTGTRLLDDGTCPDTYDERYGVAVDFTGDGVADSWSGETMPYCIDCRPFRGADLNLDGREELIVTLQFSSQIEYGVFTVRDGSDGARVVPVVVGQPGHEDAGFVVGEPFQFWVGSDETSYWFYCDALPVFWLTHVSRRSMATDSDVIVHETNVSMGADGIAHILNANSFTVPAGTEVDLQYATTEPDCGLGVDVWRLQAPG